MKRYKSRAERRELAARAESTLLAMAGRDHRRNMSSSSSTGRRAPERERERWAWSPGPSSHSHSQQLPRGGGGRSSASFKSLFRSIGVWFSSLSASSSTSSPRHSSPADDAIKKPPSLGHAAGRIGGSSGQRRSGMAMGTGTQCSVFSMEEILRATRNFSPALKIGQGGFGAVYKGTLPDGTLVAVKRAKLRMHNPHVDVEFRSEVTIMARIEHQSLVRFYGYLDCGDERVVVVEYVPNGTLREHLDRCNGRFLEFGARLDIAIDVAHAVTYLHMYSDHPIIHRDIKSSNILLTPSLRAKVADFGFARLGVGGEELAGGNGGNKAHVSTQVKGTAGYLDPEYLKTCQLTDRSDVYSFGVLLVELASARRPIETKRDMKERLTTRWAVRKFMEGGAAEVLDPHLVRTPATARALEMLLELALRCLGPVRPDRPSMSECCRALWAIRKRYRDDMLAADDPNATPLSFSDRASSSSAGTGDRSGELWRI